MEHAHNRIAARTLERLREKLESLEDQIRDEDPENRGAADAVEQINRHASDWIARAEEAVYE